MNIFLKIILLSLNLFSFSYILSAASGQNSPYPELLAAGKPHTPRTTTATELTKRYGEGKKKPDSKDTLSLSTANRLLSIFRLIELRKSSYFVLEDDKSIPQELPIFRFKFTDLHRDFLRKREDKEEKKVLFLVDEGGIIVHSPLETMEKENHIKGAKKFAQNSITVVYKGQSIQFGKPLASSKQKTHFSLDFLTNILVETYVSHIDSCQK